MVDLTFPVLLDGATGSNLMARGMPRGVCVEQWVLEHPSVLQELQKEFVAAGSQAVYAPTFGANPVKLETYGLADQTEEINRKLVAISREAVGENTLVGGDLSPTGLFVEPFGEASFDQLLNAYRRQAGALKEAGVDFIVCETLMSMAEARAAVLAARETGLPVLATATVEGGGRSLSGMSPMAFLIAMQSLGVAAVGLNCSTGPADMASALAELTPYAAVPLIAKPNVSLPDRTLPPEQFVTDFQALLQSGARLIGGCCGTTPAHIAGLRALLEQAVLPALPPVQEAPAAASEREAFFLSGQDLKLSEPISCGYSLGDDLINAEDSGATVALVNVSAAEDVEALVENAHMSRLPIMLYCDSPAVLELALRNYQGVALVSSRSEIDREALELASKKYGAIIY